jgi:hypothetical protein
MKLRMWSMACVVLLIACMRCSSSGAQEVNKTAPGSQHHPATPTSQSPKIDQDLVVTGSAPVFLENTTDVQSVRIAGKFQNPQEITIEGNPPLPLFRRTMVHPKLGLAIPKF